MNNSTILHWRRDRSRTPIASKMILSPYKNPPYRTPTPTNSSSPLPDPSPKRKRDDNTESRIPPFENDDQAQLEGAQVCVPSSPRSKVAESLKGLEIQQVRPASLRPNKRNVVPRKRLKRNSHLVDKSSPSEMCIAETPKHSMQLARRQADEPSDEVGEMPDCRARMAVSPQLLADDRQLLQVEVALPTRSIEDVEPSPLSTPLEAPTRPQLVIDRSVSPLPRSEELTSDQAALTWQYDEITGHELDPAGDDDGEGINGIGFRPTPALAYARQQRRKQQVNEWKAREAREARHKRLERRRGGVGEANSRDQGASDDLSKRMVRFEEVG